MKRLATNSQINIISEEKRLETEYNYDLVAKCLQDLDPDIYECYYCSFGPFGYTEIKDIEKIKLTKDLIIWVSTDALLEEHEFDWYNDIKPFGLSGFDQIAKNNPTKQFILCTDHIFLNDLVDAKNLHVVNFVSELWRLKPEIEYTSALNVKNQNEYNWVTFLGAGRSHRIALLCYLLEKFSESTGVYSVSDRITDICDRYDNAESNFLYTCSPDVWKILNGGWKKIKDGNLPNQIFLPKYPTGEKPVSNYNECLLPYLARTRLEIVTTTLFNEGKTLFPTEKELQSFYGCNFMILNSTQGAVCYLRSLGFDMFDDVVNHNYDNINEPIQRLIASLSNNSHLLDGSVDLDKLWQERKQRFSNNIEVANNISKKLVDQTVEQLKKKLEEVVQKII